jgi:3-deoxy-D-manno-octulosonate 8-phosphate phosphatase (KDO 8-P phosphatase)
MILMDVDGVMTDGAITLVGARHEAKSFDAKDGVALWIARRLGFGTGVISGRRSTAVLRRARELGMVEVHLRTRDKLAAYESILRRRRLTDRQICYIGDDLVDLPVLGRVGMPVAVADAHPEVRRRAPFVTAARGGEGAVREVIDAILKAQGHWTTVLGWFDAPPAGLRRGLRRSPR